MLELCSKMLFLRFEGQQNLFRWREEKLSLTQHTEELWLLLAGHVFVWRGLSPG